MADSEKISACVLVIGNEVLSGRTKDANLNWIATRCTEKGIRLAEARVIPDEEDVIVDAINECRQKYNYVFTTGGIGPTHDDITTKSISKALKKKYQTNKEAYKILDKYYGTKNFNKGRKKMAKTPAGAKLIYNPSSGAPGFFIKNVYTEL